MRTKILAIILVGMFLLTSFTTVTATSLKLYKSEITEKINNGNTLQVEEDRQGIQEKINNFIKLIGEFKDRKKTEKPGVEPQSHVRRIPAMSRIVDNFNEYIRDKINNIKKSENDPQKRCILMLALLSIWIEYYIQAIVTGYWFPGLSIAMFFAALIALIDGIIFYIILILFT